jgi:hypothetical protein
VHLSVIRPFALADIFLVQRLQRSETPLAIEHILTHPRPPLWLALTAPWPWAGVGVATFVLKETESGSGQTGFVQLLKRSARPEADLLHLAPAWSTLDDYDSLTPMIWRKLLAHCGVAAALHGLERIYVSVPLDGVEQACLAEAGFRLYTRETIFRLEQAPAPVRPPAGFRRQLPQDSWALQRLYARSTPHLVQQAEGAGTGHAGSPPLSWWEPERWQGIIWAPAGEVRGAVQVHLGRAGHWMRIWGATALTARELRLLVEQGLRLIASAHLPLWWSKAPVYVSVRDYDAGLSGALTGFGFTPFVERARSVRHTLAPCRKRVTLPLAALEAPQKIQYQAGEVRRSVKVHNTKHAARTNY